MKIKYIVSVMAIVAITKSSFAQYSQDALRYSLFQTGSTARIKAIGNAGTAVGGDLSSISGNPAGLGFFSKSEISITPEFNGSQIGSSYLGQSNSASASNLNLNNAAAVFFARINKPRGSDKNSGLVSLNFGIAYDRIADYYENTYYGGVNSKNSIADYYAQLGNSGGVVTDGTGTNLQDWAYSHYLIDHYTSSNSYQSNVQPGVNQTNNAFRTGGESELSLSMGGNVSNQFYFGLGIGITSLRYNTTSTNFERGSVSVATAVINPFNSTYEQDQVTKGTGFNARVGFIYKPVNEVRIGATITTPTYYTIDDSYSESLNSRVGGSNYSSGPQSYPLTYNLRTPLKVNSGIAIFAGNLGFVSADIEYLDYSSIHIDDNGSYSASNDNSYINQHYRSTVNARFGAEARLSSSFFLRGGYGIQGNPLADNHVTATSTTTIVNVGSSIKTASGGLGYRFGNYYFDATYTNVMGNQYVYPYEINTGSPSAYLSRKNNNVFVTVGLRF